MLPIQPFSPFDANYEDDIDLVMRNTAFTYDNAVALLAFLADGSVDSLRRARIIGDAFVYAAQHDRFFDDGRMRSDYAAGDISLPPGWTPNNRVETVSLPGFYYDPLNTFYEVEQVAIDTGNNAWAMIALLALYQRTHEPIYLNTARSIGNFIRTLRNDTGIFQGFQGGLQRGIDDPEKDISFTKRVYASSEHNIDIVAAFTRMFEITGELQWKNDAEHARHFVEAMWDTSRNCYLAGTTEPNTRNANKDQLPLDVQPWSTLAIPSTLTVHPEVLACAEKNHRNTHDGVTGYDFNDDKDAVWFEGTAQMGVAYVFSGQSEMAENIWQNLILAQSMPPLGDTRGIVAASHDGLSTGFLTPVQTPFKYYRRLHIAATAWNLFAQLKFNPFYQTVSP